MNSTLEQRLRARRARVLVRSWEFRQRNHARGAWFRLRRVLAQAAEAYVVPSEVAGQLMAEGCQPEPVGDEFQPRKTIVFVTPERLARIPAARPLPVRLTSDLLMADHLVLVPFAAATVVWSGPVRSGPARPVRSSVRGVE